MNLFSPFHSLRRGVVVFSAFLALLSPVSSFADAAAPATPPVPAPSATPAPAPLSIPFNAENKAVAANLFKLIGDIQDSEFDPTTNLAAITKLQDTIASTSFEKISSIQDYLRDSLTMNSIRSKDLKVDSSTGNRHETLNVKRIGAKGNIGLRNIGIGGDLERSTSKKNDDDNSAGVTISSHNEVVTLDKARQQQSTSYGHVLLDLKRLGFARPVEPKELIGRWRWRCHEDAATYEFNFMADGTVAVKLKADNPRLFLGHGFVNKGSGEWSIDYRALTVTLTPANLAFFWKQRPLLFFKNLEIISIDQERLVLALSEDNELKRIQDSKHH